MKRKIRVALIGIGNAASALVQGATYYSQDRRRSGLWHEVVGGCRPSDIEFVDAYDIDSRKIGLDLSEAIHAPPNALSKYLAVPKLGVPVKPGFLLDPLPQILRSSITLPNDVSTEASPALDGGVDVVVNLISSGLSRTSETYARRAAEGGACFVNATPSPIATKETLVSEFQRRRLVVVGDDLLSQFGGTAFHKGILDFMNRRGIRVRRSYQLDVGGGTETLNTIDEFIRADKRKMKTEAIASELPYGFETVAGTTDYVDYLGNTRTSYFWIEGDNFLGSTVKVDVYLKTSDGPNAGNILFDVIRAAKAAKDAGQSGAPPEICAYGFKKTPVVLKLHDAVTDFSKKYLA